MNEVKNLKAWDSSSLKMITIELFTEVKLLKNLTGFENLLGLESKSFHSS